MTVSSIMKWVIQESWMAFGYRMYPIHPLYLKKDNRPAAFVSLSFPGRGGAFGLEILRRWGWLMTTSIIYCLRLATFQPWC